MADLSSFLSAHRELEQAACDRLLNEVAVVGDDVKGDGEWFGRDIRHVCLALQRAHRVVEAADELAKAADLIGPGRSVLAPERIREALAAYRRIREGEGK